MKRLLGDAASKGLEATLITSETKTVSVSFDFNRLKTIKDTESLNMNLQVIKGNKLGVANSTRVGGEKELLENAMNVADFGPKINYKFPSPEPHANPEVFCQNVEDLTVDKMIALGEELMKFIKSLDPSINGSVEVEKNILRKDISNTHGLNARLLKTGFAISSGFQFVKGQNLLNAWDWDVSTAMEYNLERIQAKLKEDFDIGKNNTSVEPGLYDVIFTPMGFSDLINPIVTCLNGRAVMRGISPLKNRLGGKIFSPLFSLTEDGTLDKGLGSQFYDNQGVACRKTPLIEKGILREYILDLESAYRLGRQPIGTGSPEGANPNNLLVSPGNMPWNNFLKDMEKGIIIDQTMGAWAGNPYTGTVTGNIALGYLVRDGKKVGRVKNCMFSLNVFTHLKSNLLAMSRETKNLGSMVLPYCLIEGVSITGSDS
ncbi:MAG: TldD/PmbA family protein [Firmicutes bacterium]|nr:TldD/PmbA family protein [Bacillota bacterium]